MSTGAKPEPARSSVYDPAGYGQAHADIYDRIYPQFPTDAAVSRILDLAADRPGRVLDLGSGTGRLALPLRAAGIDVHGIDASPAMTAKLRSHPLGADIPVWQADLADFDLPDRYSVIVCAVSTLFMLPDRRAQTGCLRSAQRHLESGGVVVIEAFVPDSRRYDHDRRRVELRHLDDTSLHLVVSTHHPDTETVAVTHVLADPNGVRNHHVTLHYATPAQLDAMAAAARLDLVERAGSWDHRPYDADTTDHISVYRSVPGSKPPPGLSEPAPA